MSMRKKGWITGILLGILLLAPMPAKASGKIVADQADLFTEAEEQTITERAKELSEEWKQDYVVVTTLDAEGKSSEEYADDYYDTNGYGENGALFLIDLDNGNVWISTSGTMIRFFTDERIELVIDAGYSSLQGKDYGTGILQMLDQTEVYMKDGIPGNQYNYNVETGEVSRYRSITLVEFLIALGIAAACGIIFAVSVRSSYKMKHSDYSYPFQKNGRLSLSGKEDRFINEVVTRRHIPQDTSSGSGGGGQSSVHTSSSGSSHGGGGRSL